MMALVPLPKGVGEVLQVLQIAGYDPVADLWQASLGGWPCEHDGVIHGFTQTPSGEINNTTWFRYQTAELIYKTPFHWNIAGNQRTRSRYIEAFLDTSAPFGGCTLDQPCSSHPFPGNVGKPEEWFYQCDPSYIPGFPLPSGGESSVAVRQGNLVILETNSTAQVPRDRVNIHMAIVDPQPHNPQPHDDVIEWQIAEGANPFCLCSSVTANQESAYCYRGGNRTQAPLTDEPTYYFTAYDHVPEWCVFPEPGFHVDRLSLSEGFPEGGQDVWVTGSGFEAGLETQATIDGIPMQCEAPIGKHHMRCTIPPHPVGEVDIVVAGETFNFEYTTDAGGIVITSPQHGEQLSAGEFTVQVAVTNGFPIDNLTILLSTGHGKTLTSPPWETTFPVPEGQFKIRAMARRAIGTTIDYRQSADLAAEEDISGLAPEGLSLRDPLPLNGSTPIEVGVLYSDGFVRDLPIEIPIACTVTGNPAIVTVEDCIVTPVDDGMTAVQVSALGYSEEITVVSYAPFVLYADGWTDPELRWNTINLRWTSVDQSTSYDVVRGHLTLLRSSSGDFATSVTECVSDNLDGLDLTSDDTVSQGHGFFYLVRPNYGQMGGEWGHGRSQIESSLDVCP